MVDNQAHLFILLISCISNEPRLVEVEVTGKEKKDHTLFVSKYPASEVALKVLWGQPRFWWYSLTGFD